MKIVDKCINITRFILQANRCYLCDSVMQFSQFDCCDDCLKELPYINQPCSRCARPMLTSQAAVCGHCLLCPPIYDSLLSPLEYRYPIDKLICDLKFNQKLYRASSLGFLLAEYIKLRALPLPECIIPVPLHPRRLAQRGYNQSLEIARAVSKNLNIPIDKKLCYRIKNTKPQTGLDSLLRKQNIKNAFKVTLENKYKHIAILDDVVTTGETVNAIAKILKQNGLSIIQVWSVSRTVEKQF